MDILSKFAELPDDCLLLIFKNFTLKERVRYERVNKSFASLIGYLFNCQKELKIVNEDLLCESLCHLTYNQRDLIKRCYNLVSLQIQCFTQLDGFDLNNFPHLENITVNGKDYEAPSGSISSIIFGRSLKSVKVDQLSAWLSVAANEMNLLLSSPNLETYAYNFISTDGLKHILDNKKAKYIHYDTKMANYLVENNQQQVFNTNAPKVERLLISLSFPDLIEFDQLNNITALMVNLKEITLETDGSLASRALSHLSKLEVLSLYYSFQFMGDCDEDGNFEPRTVLNTDMNTLLSKLPKLKKFGIATSIGCGEIENCQLTYEAFENVSNYCPLLTEIKVHSEPLPPKHDWYKWNDDQLFELLAPLKHLNKLSFTSARFSVAGIINGLPKLKKLNSFSISNFRSEFKFKPALAEAFIDYAKSHPKRKMDFEIELKPKTRSIKIKKENIPANLNLCIKAGMERNAFDCSSWYSL